MSGVIADQAPSKRMTTRHGDRSVGTKRLYYFTADKNALLNMEHRRLKISFSNEVNDLFELTPFDFGDNPSGKRIRRAWKRAIVKHSYQQGFISFADKWDVPTMWGYYTSNHRGVCMGFDIPEERASKIEYIPKLMAMDSRILNDGEYNVKMTDIAKKTKSSHWEYESEWRVWCSLEPEESRRRKEKEGELFFLNFGKDLVLREVLFGYRSGLSTEKMSRHLTGTDDVKFMTVRPSFREFKMVEQKDSRYWK